jgi:hypothetical protein
MSATIALAAYQLSDCRIPMISGRLVNPFDLRNEDIEIRDIAHALANICRFNGSTLLHYSVAQHCVLASRLAPVGQEIAALLHDASEAYLTDLPSPIKYLPQLDWYRAAEDEAQARIYARFGITNIDAQAIHLADKRALATEARDVLVRDEIVGLSAGVEADKKKIQPWFPAIAKSMFLRRWSELTRKESAA